MENTHPSAEPAQPPLPVPDIVLVDDDTALRTALMTILQRAGHGVHGCTDGEDALRYIERHPVRLVITDLIMPHVEGIEMIVRLRKLRPRLRVIAMSGGGRLRPETFLDAAKSLGAWRVMTKPFSTPLFLETVQEALATSEPA